EVDARAHYKAISAGTTFSSKNSQASRSLSKHESFFATGGTAPISDRTQWDRNLYSRWKQSLSQRPGLASFGNSSIRDGLKPLWTAPGAGHLRPHIEAYVRNSGKGVFNKRGIPQQQPVRKNSTFTLMASDGQWLGGSITWGYHSTAAKGYYTRVSGNPVKHQFKMNGEQLLSGQTVRIATTQKIPHSGYEGYKYLSGAKNYNKLFYHTYNNYYDEWKIWKAGLNQHAGQPIRFNDKVAIESVDYQGQTLRPMSKQYLTTGAGSYTWTIKK
ncbi:MAG: hypothetical protein AAF497_10950, partial [Planctomycetota bacterium]